MRIDTPQTTTNRSSSSDGSWSGAGRSSVLARFGPGGAFSAINAADAAPPQNDAVRGARPALDGDDLGRRVSRRRADLARLAVRWDQLTDTVGSPAVPQRLRLIRLGA